MIHLQCVVAHMSHERRKTRILSIEFCLVNKDPYNVSSIIPSISVNPKQPVAFHCSHNRGTGHGVVAELSWRWQDESCAAAPQASWCFDAV